MKDYDKMKQDLTQYFNTINKDIDKLIENAINEPPNRTAFANPTNPGNSWEEINNKASDLLLNLHAKQLSFLNTIEEAELKESAVEGRIFDKNRIYEYKNYFRGYFRERIKTLTEIILKAHKKISIYKKEIFPHSAEYYDAEYNQGIKDAATDNRGKLIAYIVNKNKKYRNKEISYILSEQLLNEKAKVRHLKIERDNLKSKLEIAFRQIANIKTILQQATEQSWQQTTLQQASQQTSLQLTLQQARLQSILQQANFQVTAQQVSLQSTLQQVNFQENLQTRFQQVIQQANLQTALQQANLQATQQITQEEKQNSKDEER